MKSHFAGTNGRAICGIKINKNTFILNDLNYVATCNNCNHRRYGNYHGLINAVKGFCSGAPVSESWEDIFNKYLNEIHS